MRVLQGEKNKLTQLAFSVDGTLLAVPVWKKGVQLWGVPPGAGPVATVLDKPGATRAEFTASGRLLIQGNHFHFLLHDLGTGATTTIQADRESSYPYYGGVSPDGRYLVAAQTGGSGGGGWFFCRDLSAPDVNVWKHESKRPALGTPLFLKDGSVVTFEFDGRATACFRRDLASGKMRPDARGLLAGVGGLVHQPEGAVTSPDGSVWAVRNGRTISVYAVKEFGNHVASLTSPAKAPFTGHAFHPSGRYLLVSSADQSVKVYDAATWQAARVYEWGAGKLFSVAVSPDGTLVAAGGDKGQIVVWDWEE